MEYPTSQCLLAASHLELVHQVEEILLLPLELVHEVEEILLLPLLLVILALLPQVAGVLSYHVPGCKGLKLVFFVKKKNSIYLPRDPAVFMFLLSF